MFKSLVILFLLAGATAQAQEARVTKIGASGVGHLIVFWNLKTCKVVGINIGCNNVRETIANDSCAKLAVGDLKDLNSDSDIAAAIKEMPALGKSNALSIEARFYDNEYADYGSSGPGSRSLQFIVTYNGGLSKKRTLVAGDDLNETQLQCSQSNKAQLKSALLGAIQATKNQLDIGSTNMNLATIPTDAGNFGG
jgi:hypothetical protein